MITILRDIIILIFFCIGLGFLQGADKESFPNVASDSFLQSIRDSEALDNKDPLLMDIQKTLNFSGMNTPDLSAPASVELLSEPLVDASFAEPQEETFALPENTIVLPPTTTISFPKTPKKKVITKKKLRKTPNEVNKSFKSKKAVKTVGPSLPPGFNSFQRSNNKKRMNRVPKKRFHKLKGVTQLEDSILLNFIDTGLGVILKTLSDFLEKTFILSPKVKSKITVINPNELNKEEAYEVLLSILELSDFGVIEKGNVVKIFPKKDAKNFMTSIYEDKSKGDNSLVTKIIELKYLTPEKVSQLLKQFISKDTEQISLDNLGNKIIISGFKSHVNRFEELIKKLDKDYLLVFKPHFIRLKYGNADKLIETIQQFYSFESGSSSKGGPTSARFSQSKSSSKNMGNIKSMFSLNNGDILVVLAHQREIKRVKELINHLDQDENEKKNFYEIYLKKARVHKVLNLLVNFLQNKDKKGANGIPGRSSINEISKINENNYIILEDVKQNKLILYSNVYYHNLIKSYIDLLDQKSFGDPIVKYFPLYHILPKDISQKLIKVYQNEIKTNSSVQLKIIPDEKLNGIVVSSLSDKTIRDVEKMILFLDKGQSHFLMEEKIYVLDNANAKNVATVLESFYLKSGSAGGAISKIVADEETNSILVSSSPELLLKIETMIKKLDKESSQILVEVLIIEALLDKSSVFGIEWEFTEGGNTHATNFGIETSSSTGADLFSQLTGFKQSILDPNRFKGIINAINKKENVRIVATPRLWASNKKEASFLIGDKVPIKTSESQNTVGTVNSFSYQDVGIKLVLTPNITKNKNITLEIAQEIKTLRSIGSSDTGGNPIIQTREVKTTATVENKHTIVLGGLIREDTNDTISGVPVLSKLPFLGSLFRKKNKTKVRTEMLIFFTPTIVSKKGVKNISNISLRQFSKVMD
ncbi:MAG: hypothetical protein COB02_03670 [Candidatus Cloacimonadota bacterium]|nr:MAG: hypothetical protein COB02_03670 [Candidatus Cloacimonadota bacterium]